MPRVILDLSHDELGIVLRHLPDAEDIAQAAEVCKAFKVGSQRATAARVAASPVPLPSAKPLYVVGTKFADEPKLRRLRWAEAVAPPLTLAGGFCHCFCVSGGALIAWGGLGTQHALGEALLPTVVAGDSDEEIFARSVSCGGHHAVALDNQGAVWSWGVGDLGQLGLGSGIPGGFLRPTRLGLTGVLRIAAGGEHTLLLTENGDIFATGRNRCGQLGLGDLTPRWLPNRIATLVTRATEVSANGDRSVAVDDEGCIYEWGGAERHLAGQNYDRPHLVVFEPSGVRAPELDGRGFHARRVFTGRSHSFAVMATGELYAWGHNAFGQLGIGPQVGWQHHPERVAALAGKRVRQASAGGRYSIVLTEAGEVYTMGFEAYTAADTDDESRDGVLGHDTLGLEELNVPTLVMALVPQTEEYLKTCKVPELKREVARLGEDTKGAKALLITRLLAAQPAHDVVVEVCAGEHSCLARTADGKIFSWGENSCGQLGGVERVTGESWDDQQAPRMIDAGALARPKVKAVAPWLKRA